MLHYRVNLNPTNYAKGAELGGSCLWPCEHGATEFLLDTWNSNSTLGKLEMLGFWLLNILLQRRINFDSSEFPEHLKSRGSWKDADTPQHKENIDIYIESGGVAWNLGVNLWVKLDSLSLWSSQHSSNFPFWSQIVSNWPFNSINSHSDNPR